MEKFKRTDRKVFNPRLAKKLIHEGYKIKNIVPNKTDHKRTVFVFEEKEGLHELIKKFREKSSERNVKSEVDCDDSLEYVED